MNKDVNNDFYRIEDINKELNSIKSVQKFEYILYNLKEILEDNNVIYLDKVYFQWFMNNICSKFYFFYKRSNLSNISYDFLNFLMEKKYVPLNYIMEFTHILNKCFNNKNNLKIIKEVKEFEDLEFLKNNIIGLINNDRNFLKNTSILDLQGNFLWWDSNSFKIFEGKYNFNSKMNLFNLMIPDSKLYLYQNYGEELFNKKNLNQNNNYITFSYTIFSEKSVNLFIKFKKKNIKKNIISDKNQFDENEKIFYKYLKSLSSRFKMVSISFTKNEIKNLQKSKNANYFNFELLNKLIENQKEEKIVIKAIYCETRNCRSYLNFNYKNLENNTKIKELDLIIKKKLHL